VLVGGQRVHLFLQRGDGGVAGGRALLRAAVLVRHDGRQRPLDAPD
jgi:hypothetical protein